MTTPHIYISIEDIHILFWKIGLLSIILQPSISPWWYVAEMFLHENMWFDFLLFRYSSSEKWFCARVLGAANVPHRFHPTWLPVHKVLLEHYEFPDLIAKRGPRKRIVLWLLPVESPWENSPHSGVSSSSENRHTCEYQSNTSSQHLSTPLWRDWN